MKTAKQRHVYLHVPFCQSLCPYCAFYKSLNLKRIPSWLEQMQKDVQQLVNSHPEDQIATLYLGGGSPGVLDLEQLKRIVEPIRPLFAEDIEFTMELNPQDCSLEFLQGLKALGVNRVSLGVQSFDQKRLESIGRPGREMIFSALENIRKTGFTKASLDLIYGWSDQKWEEIERDLNTFLETGLDHLSIYRLQIEEDSVFGKTGISHIDEERDARYFERIVSFLSENGFEHYEISSFARNNARCLHNLSYWSDRFYDGLGTGASGYSPFGYYTHQENLHQYCQGQRRIAYEARDPFNAIMMGLRTSDGLDIPSWNEQYSLDFHALFQEVLERYDEYLEWKENSLSVSEKGWLILDTILVDFMMAME